MRESDELMWRFVTQVSPVRPSPIYGGCRGCEQAERETAEKYSGLEKPSWGLKKPVD